MPILRLARLLVAVSLAAAALAACKGGGSSSSSSAELRFVQGAPALQSLDYKVDSGGAVLTNAKPGAVGPYQFVTPGTHTVYLYESGESGSATPLTTCATPSLAAGSRYTLVLVATGSGGTSTTPCVFYTEPNVTPASGQGVVVWHNVAGNATITDANGNVTAALYPVFCQPAASLPCTSPTTQPGGPIVNGASVTSPQTVTTTVSAASSPGVAFTVSNAPGGTPLCQNLPSDPTLLPVAVDPSDTSNLVPNSSADTTISIFITDSGNTSGANACPVTISGSLAL